MAAARRNTKTGLRALVLLAMGALLAGAGLAGAISAAGTDGDSPMTEPTKLSKAIFAGGCFWCMEPPFDELDGVISTISGYTGGHKSDPSYEEVSAGGTGHTEAIEIVYDPAKVSYERLLEVFWRNIDPTTVDRQFCDVGDQYRTGIFYHGEEQKRLAEESKKKLSENGGLAQPIVTEITAAGEFYPAEEYHQDYYKKNPLRYKFYRYGCGRDARLEALWGDDD